ncbi:response regulator [Trichothermofontia sichuanensis B231]|uniref:response regulator n=1 Tax=Trichothermofontia sichuanensis TaxID=3045816 RepID=UPI002247CAD9|nr:response regulator [Trichothermofontia sichuanensis B231]
MEIPPLHRILLVEDDPDIQVIARLSLESVGGFAVKLCSSGREALQTAPTFSPDLILLDVMMPDMDGLTTLQSLRQIPTLATTPVIIMSARVQTHEVVHYRELGAVEVVAKPFDPMQLPTTIRQIWMQCHG